VDRCAEARAARADVAAGIGARSGSGSRNPRCGASTVDGRRYVLPREREHTEDPAHAELLLAVEDRLGELADVFAGSLGSQQQREA
jgi:hypothetical protein